MDSIILNGWQSWTPCKGQFLQIKRPCDFSPQDVTSWNLSPTAHLKKSIKGWCSWYAYGFNISEKKITDNALHLNGFWPGEDKYVLIDGGWTKDGDWGSSDLTKFPHGMKFISDQIRKIGLKPGIWISPFLADPYSELVKNHSEYFVKKSEHFVDGFRISPIQFPFIGQKYILDLEKPEVLTYLKECIHRIVVD